MPLRTDFGAFRQPVDPTRGISDVLSNLQGQVSNYEKRKDLLAQQAIENQRQEELLNLRKSQEEREARKFGRTLTGEEAAQKASHKMLYLNKLDKKLVNYLVLVKLHLIKHKH